MYFSRSHTTVLDRAAAPHATKLAATAHGATKVYGRGDGAVRRPRRRHRRVRDGPLHRHHGPERVRQEHADARRRRA